MDSSEDAHWGIVWEAGSQVGLSRAMMIRKIAHTSLTLRRFLIN